MKMEAQTSGSAKTISLDALLFALFGIIQLYRYPYFFFPKVKTLIDYLSPKLTYSIGNPSKDLVNNPIERVLTTFGILLILAYLITDFALSRNIFKHRLKYALVILMIFLTGVLPVWLEAYRYMKTSDQLYAHDGGVIQTHAAMDLLMAGKNPYTENYRGTLMDDGYDPNDPPLFHFPYMPLILFAGIALKPIALMLFGFFDIRMAYLLAYLIGLFFSSRFSKSTERRLAILIVAGLNPLITQFIAQGRNDIFGYMWVTIAIFCLVRTRLFAGAFFFAMACATKPFAWMLAPFLLIHLMRPKAKTDGPKRIGFRRELIGPAFVFALTWMVIIGPFLIWDFHSFWDDIYRFNAGTSEVNYALGGTPGFGFANFLIYFSAVESLQDYYPFWPYQLAIVGPAFILLAFIQYRNNTLRTVVANYALILFIYLFFSRLFHDNYLGYISLYLICCTFGDELAASPADHAAIP